MRSERYTVVAIVLHWAIAIPLLAMIPIGWWMGDNIANSDPAIRAQAANVYQFHKSLGLTILVLSLARLGWRLANPPPPEPPMPAWQAIGARISHWGFYGLMIALPLSGWVYVSTGWAAEQGRALSVPTFWFDLFQVPHLAFIAGQPEEARRQISENAIGAHSLMAWLLIGLAALHVAAALKHHFLDKDGVLVRMIPGLKPLAPSAPPPAAPGRTAALGAGLGAIALAFALLAAIYPRPESASAAADAPTAAVSEAAPPALEGAAPEAMPPAPSGEDRAAVDQVAPAAPAPAEMAQLDPKAKPPAEPAGGAPAAGPAPAWKVAAGESALRFSGTHAGSRFEGRFERWSADIRFDPANLAGSRVVVTIQTGSAATGDGQYDATLTEGEWFNPKGHPTARFEATTFSTLSPGRYVADGRLTIKGITRPLKLPFTLDIAGDTATMKAEASVDRTQFDIGMSSDAGGEWVSKEIGLTIAVKATRAS